MNLPGTLTIIEGSNSKLVLNEIIRLTLELGGGADLGSLDYENLESIQSLRSVYILCAFADARCALAMEIPLAGTALK